jgi:hypothetical protein
MRRRAWAIGAATLAAVAAVYGAWRYVTGPGTRGRQGHERLARLHHGEAGIFSSPRNHSRDRKSMSQRLIWILRLQHRA